MYSDKVMEHFENPRNVGKIENPDGVGKQGNPVCGDVMELTIKVRGDIIDDIKFRGYAFQIEMKFRSDCKGFKIQEHPIIFTDRTAGTSKMSTKIFREALFGVIELKIKRIFGRI